MTLENGNKSKGRYDKDYNFKKITLYCTPRVHKCFISFCIYFVGLLCDSDGKCAPITWSSTKIKRIARSTLAIECLALQDATDAAYLIFSLVSEMLYGSEKLIDIIAKTDSKGLHSALLSTKAVQDKRLRVDIAYLKQLLKWQELEKVLWISSVEQLADCLTKRTASSRLLLETLYNSFLR